MRAFRRLIGIASALALLPFLIILLTVALAGIFGCDVNESGPQTCMAFGSDWGGVLSGMLSAGWLGLLTIPFLMGIFIIWLAVEAAASWRKRRKARRTTLKETSA